MEQQQVPLLSRVVLLHAAVIGVVLAIMQVTTNLSALAAPTIQLPAPTSLEQAAPAQGKPTRLKIPRLNINTQVVSGAYDTATKTWTVASDKAQYMPTTAPNLTLIYGHNTSAVFELTNSLQVGDTLVLTTEGGVKRTYRYTSDHITTPSDTSDLFKVYSKPTVALLTCNGFWSQDRRFMFFELEEDK